MNQGLASSLFSIALAQILSAQENLKLLNFDEIADGGYDHVEARAESKIVFDSLAQVYNWDLTHTSGSEIFTNEGLQSFDAVLLNNPSLKVFTQAEQNALVEYIQNGGGVVGIHGASHAHRDFDFGTGEAEWPWWHDLIGKLHVSGPRDGPNGPRGYNDWVVMRDTTPEFTADLPETWIIEGVEWYFYTRDLPDSIHVIATAEVKENQPEQPDYYPVTWCQHFDGGRSWYTNIGHYAENFHQEEFLIHLLHGIQFAANPNATGCGLAPDTTGQTGISVYQNTGVELESGMKVFFNALGIEVEPTHKGPTFYQH